MKLLFLDFETYYDDAYSLRKLTPPQYILDKRFECIMCSVIEDGGTPYIVDGPNFPTWIAQFDPSQTTVICYNALFDCAILAWRYGFIPVKTVDVLGMVRSLCGHLLPSASLGVAAKT